ncbi:LCP family protein [Clostridium botulinum]|uniref:Transcriptional regulator n=1 Tax=Clostridium botulinum TaxID=1491 RepID=A0A9Q1UYJ7_CLOBO|nr:LCP family protein [Clostridium botulinum]AEB76789.1 Cell envelope-related transcriptional attenuator, putative [Clostridium botulinum BKT015925]KEI02514.1 transcriptional regulator [Clostridium botulinum C/D str. Sp77]KEI02628.1 transcriptional regulator [Clostridium botulinum D str. 16868]KOA76922.1 transcriptional regulator [Clostridium botulinum]KOA80545.1 transcriptional regulator [Clostridium botulinum]
MAKHEKKKNNKKSSIKKVIFSILMILVIGVTGACGYLYWSFKNNTYIKNNYLSKEDKNEEDNYEEVDGISNILLIGNDARNLNEKARSDAILILSIDNINKKLKLISIMRDSYVEIPGYGEQKINHALAYGGPELLKDTIEKNFNLKLHDYGIINFNGFQELVDSIGGLEINVSEVERKEMNKFIPEVNPKDPHLVKKAGMQHLDGQQVLSYSRIRKIGNGDYDRTERQREVISLIIDKLKDTNVLKYPILASKLFPYIKTNMDVGEILNYAYTIYKIGSFTPEQMLIPVPEITEPQIVNGKGWVVLMDKEQNAQIMHDFIFNNKRYDSKSLDYTSFKKAMEKYKNDINNTTKPTNKIQPYQYDKEECDAYESRIKIDKKDISNRINKSSNKYKNKIKNKTKNQYKPIKHPKEENNKIINKKNSTHKSKNIKKNDNYKDDIKNINEEGSSKNYDSIKNDSNKEEKKQEDYKNKEK